MAPATFSAAWFNAPPEAALFTVCEVPISTFIVDDWPEAFVIGMATAARRGSPSRARRVSMLFAPICCLTIVRAILPVSTPAPW